MNDHERKLRKILVESRAQVYLAHHDPMRYWEDMFLTRRQRASLKRWWGRRSEVTQMLIAMLLVLAFFAGAISAIALTTPGPKH